MRYKECTLDVVVFTVCSLFVYSVIYITPMFDYIYITTSLLSENDISIYLPCTGILWDNKKNQEKKLFVIF